MNNVLKGKMRASGKHRTVLCVDDNDQLRSLLKIILTKAGYKVTEANTSAEAKQAVEVTKPALVVLDVDLPDGNGLVRVFLIFNSLSKDFEAHRQFLKIKNLPRKFSVRTHCP